MAKETKTYLGSKKERKTDLGFKNEEPEVVAKDFNLFYRPDEMTVDPAVDTFVKSLDAYVKGAGTKGVLLAEHKEKELSVAEAVQERAKNKKDLKSAVESGQIDENANPYLIEKYKELDLNEKAREFKSKLYEQYEALGMSENSNAGEFDSFYKNQLEKFIKDNELLNYDAIELNNGFFKNTDKIRNSLENTHNQTQLGKIGERYKEGLKNNIINEIEEANDGDATTVPKLGETINKIIQENIHLRDGTQLRDIVLDAVSDWIKNTDDFEYADEVLDNLMKYVEGGTNKFENIGVVKNKIDALKEELLKERNSFNDENIKVYNNKVNIGKIEIREKLAEKMKEGTKFQTGTGKEYTEPFNFYAWRKTDEYLNLMPEVQEEAKKYYSSMSGSFKGTTDANVLTEIWKRIEKGDVYGEGGADKFLEANKDLFSKADYEKFKTKTIPNAFYTTGDELTKHPIVKDFDTLAKDWMRSGLVVDKTTAFLRYKDWEEEIFKWMKDNPLTNYKSKTERAEKFEAFVKEKMKNFSLTGLEEPYVPPNSNEEKFVPPNSNEEKFVPPDSNEEKYVPPKGKAELQVDISNVEIIPSNLIHSHAINEYKKKHPNAISQFEYNEIQSDPDYKVDLETVIIIPKDLTRGHQINIFKKKNPNAISQRTYDRIKKKQSKFNKKAKNK